MVGDIADHLAAFAVIAWRLELLRGDSGEEKEYRRGDRCIDFNATGLERAAAAGSASTNIKPPGWVG